MVEDPEVVPVVGVPVPLEVPLPVPVAVGVPVPLEVGGRVVVPEPDDVGRVVVGVVLGVEGVLPDPSTELLDPAEPPDGIGTSPSCTVCTVRPLWSMTKWGTTAYGMLSAAEAGKPR